MGLTAIIKPTHECNLSCSYCYVDPNAETGRMTDVLMAESMKQVAECSSDKSARFIWHGGEPLLFEGFYPKWNFYVKKFLMGRFLFV